MHEGRKKSHEIVEAPTEDVRRIQMRKELTREVGKIKRRRKAKAREKGGRVKMRYVRKVGGRYRMRM